MCILMKLWGQKLSAFIGRVEWEGTPKMKICKNSLPLTRVDADDFKEDFTYISLPRLSESL